ncbi:MAG: FHA domain-containing protein [Chloroflexota bacterium]
MPTLETLFDQYKDLRLSGKSQEAVFELMKETVVNNLNREERNTLAIKCRDWERDRTQPNLNHAQREALRRTALTNITLKITFCPACDTPNAPGVTRCQVCDTPLAVEYQQKNDTTAIKKAPQGSVFLQNTSLVLKMVTSNHRVILEPQMSPTGIKVGRAVRGAPIDVDLDPLGGGDYGVSRIHAVLRFDKAHNRVVIIDNNSTNGTYVNDVQIPPYEETTLADGDQLKLARMQFIVAFKNEA